MEKASVFRRLRVLVLDDEETTRRLLRRMLARMDITQISEAESGEQALLRLEREEEPVDIAICDWNLGGMSGMEFIARARALHPGLAFLMVTGRADLTSVTSAKRAGIAAYVAKPVAARELEAKLLFLLRRAA